MYRFMKGFNINFIYLFWLHWVIIVPGLSLLAESGGYSLVVECGLLTAVASFVAEHGLYTLRHLVVQAHGLRHPAACGIFLD